MEFVDGRSITEYVQYPKGDPENSLEWAEVKGKFALLVDGILDKQGTSEVISICENIESVDDCGQLLKTVNKYGVF